MTGLVRTMIERLSRGRRLWRRAPREFGDRPILVSPDAALRWLKPGSAAFDQDLVDVARYLVRPGDLVWDIGANVGAFGLMAAHRSRQPVLCVDADPFLADLVRRTASANPDIRLDVVCAAVGDRDGIAEFAIAGRGRASSGLAAGSLSTQHGQTRQRLFVPMLRPDSLLEGREAPTFVKVDVEGGEGLFVEGAARLIDTIRPRFLIEVSSQQQSKVFSRFEGAGYALRRLSPTGLESLDAGRDMQPNIVAVPAESLPG